MMADKQGLGTVLQLLLDNGLKFSEENVEVTAEQVGDKVRIAIRDYGIGIAQDQREKIFDTFYQVDSSATRRYGGTGVGLAIVRLILERHQIQVKVDSVVGQGSTFWFLMPVADLHSRPS
jgi:signal transduction histidine kinase